MVDETQYMNGIRRKVLLCLGIIIGLVILTSSTQAQEKNVSIYGEVITIDGDSYEGFLRWGSDEVYWVEMLNAQKTSNDFLRFLSEREVEELAEQSSSNSWLGVDLGILSIWEDKISRNNHSLDIRFGDIHSIEPTGRSRARITIKNGVILEVSGEGYSDIGGSVKVMDNELGEIAIKWNRIDRVLFMPARSNEQSQPFGAPIYGKVSAGRKGTFHGLIQWDEDERFQNELLDGKDKGSDRAIPFKNIKTIEKNRDGVLITLQSNRELRLTGSNDVNQQNRGIIVFDPDIGRIDIPWTDFNQLEVTEGFDRAMSYNDFPTSNGLSGTVVTIEGDRHQGMLVYDLDESWEFEMLDGKDDRVEFNIAFRNISSIIPKNYNYSLVTLKNGESLLIGNERDVTDSNDGVLVFPTKNDEPIYIKWSKIDEIIFD
jgi:hypothetical protein